MKQRLIFFVNDAAFFLSHRLPIAIEARDRGYDVAVISPQSPAVSSLTGQGIRHHPIVLPRGRIDFFSEIRSLWTVFSIFRKERPNLVHLITSKPIIYGGIAARVLGIPIVAAVSGLGYIFIAQTLKARLQRSLALLGYRLALHRPRAFPIFQNKDNLRLFRDAGILWERPTLISGSGVDLARFDPTPRPSGEVTRFVLSARMLRCKGVLEFVAAARLMRQEGCLAEFWLVGDVDTANPDSVSRVEMQRFHNEGAIVWLGFRSDIERVLRDCDVVVLPSYDEGFPKTLVDAAAAGRAVITTDVAGCREALDPSISGFLVPPRDVSALTQAMRKMAEDRELCRTMGAAGRELAERQFGIERIVDQHFDLFTAITGPLRSPQ